MIYENDHLSFATYDDEHHRVAFVDFGPLAPRDQTTELGVKASEPPGLHHVAFTFPTAKEGQDWLRTPAFDQNPIGVEFDPDELAKRFNSGVPEAELVARGD